MQFELSLIQQVYPPTFTRCKNSKQQITWSPNPAPLLSFPLFKAELGLLPSIRKNSHYVSTWSASARNGFHRLGTNYITNTFPIDCSSYYILYNDYICQMDGWIRQKNRQTDRHEMLAVVVHICDPSSQEVKDHFSHPQLQRKLKASLGSIRLHPQQRESIKVSFLK